MHYLSDYQTFDNVQEMNYHVKQHTNVHKYKMNDTQRTILQFIAQYSVKYAGASHLKTETIANSIGKHRRTVERSISVLVSLGIIEKISTTRRVSGGKGANVYRILPYVAESEVSHCEQVEKSTESKDEQYFPRKQSDTSINLLNVFTYTYKESRLAPPYKRFKDFVEQFIGKGQRAVISRLYGVYLANTKALRKAYEDNELIDVALRALGVTFSAIKRIEVRNIAGYFHGVLNKLLDEMYQELIYELFDL